MSDAPPSDFDDLVSEQLNDDNSESEADSGTTSTDSTTTLAPDLEDETADAPSATSGSSLGLGNRLTSLFGAQEFTDWYVTYEQRRNLQEGYGATRNDPAHQPDDSTLSPSQLDNCQRMNYYQARNAPSEDGLPHGIFRSGHDFEELVELYLREVIADKNEDVLNPVPIEFSERDVTITGSTDPVLVDLRGNIVLPVEVKTTGSLHYIRKDGEPKDRHKAQAHAYARGLQEKFNLDEPPTYAFIYASRETLDVETFFMEFDEDYWESVLDWCEDTVEYRVEDVLPPTVSGEKEYMCGYCDFRHRCGAYEPGIKPEKHERSGDWVGDMDYWWDDTIADELKEDPLEDQPAKGFVPLKKYPEQQVVEHLIAHEDVLLTPTLAHQHPHLVADGTGAPDRIEETYGDAPQRDVYEWVCDNCSNTYEWDSIDWDGDLFETPDCPNCKRDAHESHPLRGPTPAEMHSE